MKYLIINADDFGLSTHVNEGIIKAFEAGGITHATLMVKRGAAGEALRYAKEHPSLPVGLHLDLDEVMEGGGKGKGQDRFNMARMDAMLQDESFLKLLDSEIDMQIKAFKDTGLELTHMDGHHHLHALPRIFQLLIEKMSYHGIKTVRLSQSFDLVRYPPIEWDADFFEEMKDILKQKGIIHTDHFITGWQPWDLHKVKDGATELMTHPATREDWRVKELATLTSAEWLSALKKQGICLTSFRELARREEV